MLSAEETQTLLQIFIPVSFIVTLLIILILVFARKTQLCQKKKKRKDVIIRNNEDIQLLDRMNFVNKNPTYFMTSQDKSEEKKISIKEIPYERVKIIETVGEGAFGHVYKGISFINLPNVHLHVNYIYLLGVVLLHMAANDMPVLNVFFFILYETFHWRFFYYESYILGLTKEPKLRTRKNWTDALLIILNVDRNAGLCLNHLVK